MRIETLAVHAGLHIDKATRSVAPPINLSTTFERDANGDYPGGYVYSRGANPNRDDLEQAMCVLEGGVGAAAFSSGMAAILSVFQSLAPGDHVVAPDDVYRGTAHLLEDVMSSWGLGLDFVDLTDPGRLEAAVRPETRLVWLETPSNPLLRITDIERTAAIAHSNNAICVCDSTLATPALTRPLDLGADLVVHSTTKYLGGHGDVLGGIVVSRADDDFFKKIKRIQYLGGAVPSPFECWLVMRGLKTLPYRVRAHSENALAVAEYLAGHPEVERVYYPGLTGHPGWEIAKQQMGGFGGIISFQVRGGREKAFDMAGRVRIIVRATSLGGPVSLIEHRASYEGPGTRAPENLLRLSVGLEHPDDLIEDLAGALDSRR
ncbi:MAG: aminotransferase class I/II-fold pyridoxal phosphate-dependent enzyme [Firmicutes bacterium]|nr:aminotransferase class I/II-fold pyridoxal phosphate-dependent enzyme [Bacillota bacterium]